MSSSALDIRNAGKTYRNKVRALDDVSIEVGRGEIFGLLGPNGAGKSTLIKILMTVIRADHVEGTMLGSRIGHKPTLARVGYLPEAHRFPRYLTGMQMLDYYAALAKVPRNVRRERARCWLDRVGMLKWGEAKISQYSKGMLQRIGLAQAMMNDPDLVFLDEPTDGLDPVGRRDVRRMLVEMREQGKTVFLNSHLLSELELVCSRAAILNAGKIVRQGTMQELTETKSEVRITAREDLSGMREALADLEVTIDKDTVIVPGQVDAAVNAVIDRLRGKGMTIHSVVPTRASLEDVYLEAVQAGVTPSTVSAFPIKEVGSQ